MATSKMNIDDLLVTQPKRSLQSALFNIAHAYAQSADSSWEMMQSTKNADFAAPSIMCQSFAVELLLKFFLAVDHPSATTADELTKAGVKLRCHKYSELFDQLLPATKSKIASMFIRLSGKQADVTDFRDALIAQGDDPFVYWRYVYEQKNGSHFNRQAFNLVTDTLGKAAEVERKATQMK